MGRVNLGNQAGTGMPRWGGRALAFAYRDCWRNGERKSAIGFRGQLHGAYRDMQHNPSPFSETSTTNHSEVEEIVSVPIPPQIPAPKKFGFNLKTLCIAFQ
jgi:hypothetical protein